MREIADSTTAQLNEAREVLTRVEVHEAAHKRQAEKFADLARELECDESEDGFDERLGRLARVPKAEGAKDDA